MTDRILEDFTGIGIRHGVVEVGDASTDGVPQAAEPAGLSPIILRLPPTVVSS